MPDNKELFYLGSFAEAFAQTDEGPFTRDAELFSVGKHRGVEYDENDLEVLAANFAADDLVPLQYDHSESAKDTIGFLRDVRVEEGKLLGTVEVLDDSAQNRIKLGLNKKLSISFYLHETEEGIKPFKLREVSLVAFPQVKSARLFSEDGSNVVTTYDPEESIKHKEAESMEDKHKELREQIEAELKAQYADQDQELQRLRQLAEDAKIAAREAKVEKFAEAKKVIPAQKDALKELLVSLNDEQLDLFEKFMENQSTIDLSEQGEFEQTDKGQVNKTDDDAEFEAYYEQQVKRFGRSL
ncbi:hypothetical protein EG878_14510 [Enterococcus faecalis]|nr:hypothetical protein EG878_14510 [Enterococcus faecalis]